MLLDLLHLLTTPAPAAQRRFGYLRDSVWLMSRARRCRRAWAQHLEASRAVMRAAIAATERGDTAVVLGSGLLLDVPLADLAARFRRVVLVDAVHLRPARRAIRAFANVETLTADLSGAMALMTGAARDLEPCLPPVCTESGTGLVISANLLSQLPIRPVERLEASRHPLGAWTPEHGDAFGRRIVEGHLKALAGLRARVCLVTDIDETEEDRQGRVHVRHDLLYGTRLDNPEREWTWELAPFGEAARNRRLIHRVVAFSDWHG